MAVLFVNDSPAPAVTTKSVPSCSALPANAGRIALATTAATHTTKVNVFIFPRLPWMTLVSRTV